MIYYEVKFDWTIFFMFSQISLPNYKYFIAFTLIETNEKLKEALIIFEVYIIKCKKQQIFRNSQTKIIRKIINK